MSSELKAEQRSYIKFCVELRKTPIESKKMLEMTQSGSSVSRALVYRWHKRFTDDPSTPYSAKNGGGRPSIITESLTSEVSSALREDARLTIRDIAMQFDFANATAHRLMDRKGILLSHFVPHGQTVNSAYYSKVSCITISLTNHIKT